MAHPLHLGYTLPAAQLPRGVAVCVPPEPAALRCGLTDIADIRYALRKKRFDYFLIWGHGMQYKDEILAILRQYPSLEIVRLEQHRPKSIARFVRQVYSYDYAPFEHLRAKTRYLLSTPPDLLVIFALNSDAREITRGRGAFRHLECERTKALKEDIRDRFNPRREDGRRTEDHVIHASDNESQVDHMLKLLGHKEGLGFLQRVPNRVVDAPYYLRRFTRYTIRCVSTDQLRCHIWAGPSEQRVKSMVKLEDTPQFKCLCGDAAVYQQYLDAYLGRALTQDYSVDNLQRLAAELDYLSAPYESSYILAAPSDEDTLVIQDGVHRACVLRWRGLECFPVAVLA